MTSCDGLVGLAEDDLTRRFGESTSRRTLGPDTWVVFASEKMSLRIRLTGDPVPKVASWTASFAIGFRHLSDAARTVGLWPAAGPEEDASGITLPLVRRALPCSGSDRMYSLTATVRQGRFKALSVFDEDPDWL